MNYDVIIVGAGASGLMAAIAAARQGSSVLVIEHKDKAGKKILATGNGKCNFTNLIQIPECYRSNDSAFPMKVLSCFDESKTIQFFEELGIYPKNRNGYLYPNSEQASSIVQVLMLECERLKVEFHYNETVKSIQKPYYTVYTEHAIYEEKLPSGKKKKGTGRAPITIEKRKYLSKKIILATGGCASPQLGSDGSGFILAKSFGHTIIKPLPALVQLKASETYLSTISGVRLSASVRLKVNNKQISKEEGEVIFTDYGISGIPVLQISRFAAKALDQGEKVVIELDFLPELTTDTFYQMVKKRIKQNSIKTTEELLLGIINHKLAYIIVKAAGLDPVQNAGVLNDNDVKKIVHLSKTFRMNIIDTNSFEQAQVCAGGVSTAEINENTLESKLSGGLYLAGELIDVDGTCGGYNLQWAWSSGYVAGTSAGKKLK